MHEPKTYFVYFMNNRSKTLYVGVTNSLIRRVHEHKLGIGSLFCAKQAGSFGLLRALRERPSCDRP